MVASLLVGAVDQTPLEITRNKRQVTYRRPHCAIVVTHDVITFPQRGPVMTRGHAVGQIADNGFLASIGIGWRLFQHLDAPVIVGTQAVLQVISRHEVTTGNKGLMTNHHTIQEAVSGQVLGCGQVTLAYHIARLINKLRLAIDDPGVIGSQLRQSRQYRVISKAITSIQKKGNALAHGQFPCSSHHINLRQAH